MSKLHKCKVCKDLYVKTRPLQQVCSPSCALELAGERVAKSKQLVAKAEKKVIKAKLEGMKTRPELLKAAQQSFNAFIRARDEGKPCICCGKPLNPIGIGGGFDAGHYRSVGSAPHLRFDERNVHGQTKHCNNYLAGNHVEYRKGLIERIGLDAVEALELDNDPRKYTRDELIELAKHYRQLTRELKNGVK